MSKKKNSTNAADEKLEETKAEVAEETAEAETEVSEQEEIESPAEEEAAPEADDKTEEKAADESEETEETTDKKETKAVKDSDIKAKEKEQKKAEKKNKRSLKARAFKRGWFSVALVAVFIAGVILVNLLANTLVERIPALVADTTGSGSFDLTDVTYDYLKGLKKDITITVLADEKTYREGGEYYIQADSLLHKYKDFSSKINLDFIDLASNPTFPSKYPDDTLAQYGIIVESADGYKYLATTDYFETQIDYSTFSYYIAGCRLEEAVTSAILNVTTENKPKVAFISGITDEDYSGFQKYLENNGFETQELSPAIDDIPDDTSILVLFAPNVDLDSAYVDKISAYLNNGGNYGKQLLYMPSSSLAPTPNVDSLLEEWGVKVDNGYAIENDMSKISQITYGVYLFATDYTDSTYTAKMKNSSLPFCVLYGNGVYTHPVDILDSSKATSLLKLSDEAQIIYPPEESSDNAEPTLEDKPGLVVGAIAEKGSTKNDTDTESSETTSSSSHIVVIGSNYAVTDTFLTSNMYGNASYMMAMLNTLVGRDNVELTIETPSLSAEPLSISSAQLRVLSVLYVVIIPLGVLITGIVIFIKRRNM